MVKGLGDGCGGDGQMGGWWGVSRHENYWKYRAITFNRHLFHLFCTVLKNYLHTYQAKYLPLNIILEPFATISEPFANQKYKCMI